MHLLGQPDTFLALRAQVTRLDNVSNASTGLRLWQAETDVSGTSWTEPHPFIIPQLHADNVTAGTHMAPGNGIELQYGPHAGRLLAVLILAPDVVVYSDVRFRYLHNSYLSL